MWAMLRGISRWRWCTRCKLVTWRRRRSTPTKLSCRSRNSEVCTVHQAHTPHSLSSYGRQAFAVASPTASNSLTDDLCDLTLSTDSFRCLLKIWLFSEYTSTYHALESNTLCALYKFTTHSLSSLYQVHSVLLVSAVTAVSGYYHHRRWVTWR